MNEHIHAFRTILNELNVVRVIILVDDQFEFILFGLHDSYHVITMVLNIFIWTIMQHAIVWLMYGEMRRKRDDTSNEGQSFVTSFYASKKSTTHNKTWMNPKEKGNFKQLKNQRTKKLRRKENAIIFKKDIKQKNVQIKKIRLTYQLKKK